MVVLGQKLGGGPMDQSVGVLRIVSGALFLRSSMIRPTLLMTSKRLPHTKTASRKRTSGVHGLALDANMSCVSNFPLQGVH
jgi:hypothetical protein